MTVSSNPKINFTVPETTHEIIRYEAEIVQHIARCWFETFNSGYMTLESAPGDH